MGITINGATPVMVEPNEYFNINADAIEEKITERTKAILVVRYMDNPLIWEKSWRLHKNII